MRLWRRTPRLRWRGSCLSSFQLECCFRDRRINSARQSHTHLRHSCNSPDTSENPIDSSTHIPQRVRPLLPTTCRLPRLISTNPNRFSGLRKSIVSTFFRELHDLHSGWILSIECIPPLFNGTTWSAWSLVVSPQHRHRFPYCAHKSAKSASEKPGPLSFSSARRLCHLFICHFRLIATPCAV
jgi:hypothetical protein